MVPRGIKLPDPTQIRHKGRLPRVNSILAENERWVRAEQAQKEKRRKELPCKGPEVRRNSAMLTFSWIHLQGGFRR